VSCTRICDATVCFALRQSMVGGADIEDLGINAVSCGHVAVDVSPRSVADFPTFLRHDEVRCAQAWRGSPLLPSSCIVEAEEWCNRCFASRNG
jgi:hypothetical protein